MSDNRDYLAMNKQEDYMFLVDENGHILGNANTDRLEALVWYKRLWAKASRKYRDKYTDIEPFKCGIK